LFFILKNLVPEAPEAGLFRFSAENTPASKTSRKKQYQDLNAAGAAADKGVADDADDDESENDDHDTDDGVRDGFLGRLRRFLIASGSDIAEAADDEHHKKYDSGKSCHNTYDPAK